ncbi:phosphohydrolase [candidate division KSB3 bacterium]|uniref:Phosphohydrolase n=1 Tax=candidate division KSB3 bacterium TaxID=2044937 RepID=A0A2G6KKL5_9BACT|nr:MAG: phosphohydrolase [candidate division KSB3 bacterium]
MSQPIDYFQIIHSYIPPDSSLYRIYLPHVSLVTAKALRLARALNLSPAQQRFIEEAAMLHDIGIVEVNPYQQGTNGNHPYIYHAPAGRALLEREGLPRHALVAERHVGVGISLEEIREQRLPLPHRDMRAESIEEKVICWADLFFSKSPQHLWREKSLSEVRKNVSRYGDRQIRVFQDWEQEFGLLSEAL